MNELELDASQMRAEQLEACLRGQGDLPVLSNENIAGYIEGSKLLVKKFGGVNFLWGIGFDFDDPRPDAVVQHILAISQLARDSRWDRDEGDPPRDIIEQYLRKREGR